MNDRIKLLAEQAGLVRPFNQPFDKSVLTFSELIVEAVLDQVKERAYYNNDLDRQWIQLEFGYGPLSDAKTFRN